MKAERDDAAVAAALAALTASAKVSESTCAGDHPQNLLHLAVEAARVRCVPVCAWLFVPPLPLCG